MRTLNKKFTSFTITLFCFFLIIVSCSTAEKKGDSQAAVLASELYNLPDSNSQIEFLLPSPVEILEIVFNESITYNPDLLINKEFENNVVLHDYQALLLGVYITDLSYCLLNDDFKRSLNYLESIKIISSKIGLHGSIWDQFFVRIEMNMNNIDSLNAIFHEFSYNSFNLILNSCNHEILSLVALGSSIESIFLGYNSINNDSLKKTLKPFFVEQRIVFENFYQNYLLYNIGKNHLSKFNSELKNFHALLKLNIWLVSSIEPKTSNNSIKTTNTTAEINKELGNTLCSLRNNLVTFKFK